MYCLRSSVKALASTGVAPTIESIDAEDTITIMAQWLNYTSQVRP
jgi:hypothetical protein